MRRILGGLGIINGKPKKTIEDLFLSLTGSGVTDELWRWVLEDEHFEDAIDEEPRREALAAVILKHPENVMALAMRTVEAIEDSLTAKEFTAEVETGMANSMVMLSYILAAAPVSPRGRGDEASNSSEFLEKLWVSSDNGLSCAGERIVNALMQSMFLDGFTIDLSKNKDEPHCEEETVGQVNAAVIWEEGIGPEGSVQPDADDSTRSNRTICLQLLLSLLLGGGPSALPQEPEHPTGNDEAEDPKDEASAISRPFISDGRAHRYLCDPSRIVPYRAELLYSLLSVTMSYDPHGYGVPYGGYIAGSKQETFTHLCFQVLGFLLQDIEDGDCEGSLRISNFIVLRRPQELLVRRTNIPEEGPSAPRGKSWSSRSYHFFRELLSQITSEREVTFLLNGVNTLLGTVNQERSTYLPSSMRLPPFLPEVLVLVLHLTSNSSFVQGAVREDDLVNLIEGVLQASRQAPDYLSDSVSHTLEAAILLKLTGYREVCIALNEEFDGELPDDVPDFEGSVGDLVSLAALTLADQCWKTIKASDAHHAIVEMSLITVANLSPFLEAFCSEVATRMLSLFDRCAKSVSAKQSRDGVAFFLPLQLEILGNIVQYQYAGNTNIAYSLMTRQGIFQKLDAAVSQMRHEPTNGVCSDSRQWLRDVQAHLGSLVDLLDVTVPQLEAEVEKKDVSNSSDAKALLPRCILGLLPPPHPFQIRTLRASFAMFRVCEHVLVWSTGNGPVSCLWESDEDTPSSKSDQVHVDDKVHKQAPRKSGKDWSARERSNSRNSRARDRSGSRTRSQNQGGTARPDKL